MKQLFFIVGLTLYLIFTQLSFSQEPTKGSVSLSGYVKYYDDNMSKLIPLRKVTVELFTVNVKIIWRISATYTNNDGLYSFMNIDNVDPVDGNGRDFLLRVSVENKALRVADSSNNTYTFDLPMIRNAPDGQISNDYILGSSNKNRSIGHIFTCIMDAYDFLQKNAGWNRDQVIVRWPCESNNSEYKYLFWINGNVYIEYICIPAGREWSRKVIFHEYGHAVMMALYGYNVYKLPKDSFRGDHNYYTVSDPGFALKEGWAELFGSLMDDNANMTFLNSSNIESNGWWTGDPDGKGSNTRGEVIEGAVASIFWDIVDTANSQDETPGVDDDNMSDMFRNLWNLVLNYKPVSILEFWNYWIEHGYGQVESLYSIYKSNGVKVTPPWDVNKDGITDTLDLISVSSRLGQKPSGTTQYNPDVNRDSEVNIIDLVMIARNLTR